MKRMMLAMCAGFVLATMATAATRTDDFGDGVAAPLWKRDVHVIMVRENGRRLQFRSRMRRNREHVSLYEARGWTFDFTRNYTISVKYRMRPERVTSDRHAEVGMIIEPGGAIDKVAVGVREDAEGLKLFVKAANDNVIFFEDEIPISVIQGVLRLRYNANSDRLDVFLNGAVVTRVFNVLDGINVGNGRAKLSLGAGRCGNQFWDWNDVWLDNFRITGRIFD